MRNRSLFLLLLLVATLAAGAAFVRPAAAQPFGLYASAFLDSTRATSARITVDVPFRTLVFLKKEGYFDARFDAFLSIKRTDVENARPTTYVIHGFATVKSYDETQRRDQKARAWREIKLAPGQYEVVGTLRLRDTVVEMQRSVNLRVPDFLASGMGFGTPQVLSVPDTCKARFALWADAKDELARGDLPPDAAIAIETRPAVRFEVFLEGETTEPVPCDINYEVTDQNEQQVLYGRRRVQLTGKADEYVLVFNVDDWGPGVYRVNLRGRTRNPDRDATASTDIRVDVTRAMLGANFDDTLEILSLIASQDDLRPLRDAPETERAAAWKRFWASRDPDPTTDENEALSMYLARVQHVVREYAQFGPGWRSDRGRVYIRYGRPDQIDTAMDQRAQGEYEIWRYYEQNRSFVFYDMFGVGDYKLVEGEL